MRYLFLLSIILLFTTNCTSPQIEQHKQGVLLRYKENILVKGEGALLCHNSMHFSNINIYQFIYRINNHLISYEYAKTSNGYKFAKGIKRTVSLVFNTNAYNVDYTKGNLYFFTLDQNNKKIYLVVQKENNSALKFVYGFTKEQYQKLQYSVKNNIVYQSSQQKVKKSFSKDLTCHLKTVWSPKLIILDKLIAKPIHGRVLNRG